jgi:hypothetical protein
LFLRDILMFEIFLRPKHRVKSADGRGNNIESHRRDVPAGCFLYPPVGDGPCDLADAGLSGGREAAVVSAHLDGFSSRLNCPEITLMRLSSGVAVQPGILQFLDKKDKR